MPVAPECVECLGQLVRQLAELSTPDTSLQEEAVRQGDRIIAAADLSLLEPTHVSTRFLRAIRSITGEPDPFRQRKQMEIRLARDTLAGLDSLPDNLHGLLQLAVAGNAIDFFRPFQAVRADLHRLPPFAVDHTARLAALLDQATGPVLYLADNAGEAIFDWPLLEWLAARVELCLVVKGSPSQNDLTRAELSAIATGPYAFRVMDNGTDAVGTHPEEISRELTDLLRSATLVIAKGMANFESLRGARDLPPLAFCFMAKCPPNARIAGVEQGARVVLLKE